MSRWVREFMGVTLEHKACCVLCDLVGFWSPCCHFTYKCLYLPRTGKFLSRYSELRIQCMDTELNLPAGQDLSSKTGCASDSLRNL